MKGWRECTLGDIADIQTGPFGSQLHASDYKADGTPLIMPSNIGNHLNIIEGGIAKIAAEDVERLSRYVVEENDIVYSRRGDVEKCAFISKEQKGWLCGTGCLRVRFVDSEIYPRYYAYQLSTDAIKGWISGHAIGSTMLNLNSLTLQQVPLVRPPLPEQKAIAAVLSSLDDKIDLLHRQNATLEAMAEALFSHLFLSSGEIQKLSPIVDWISFNPKRILDKGCVSPYLEMSNVNTTTFHPSIFVHKSFSSGMKFINGDTLMARITPCLENGKTCFVTFLNNDEIGWGSTEYIVMRPISSLHPFFAYCLAKTHDFRTFAENCLTGSSGRQRVDSKHLKQYEIVAPTEQSITKFNQLASSVVPKLHNNFNQIRTLEKLRDTLLPKLMSGEVRVDF